MKTRFTMLIETLPVQPVNHRPGFYCPKCGAKMRVYWSLPAACGCVVRMRLCIKCGEKKKTTES